MSRPVDSDPLLDCLVFLTAHYGRAKSAEALTAGLAYDEHAMGPELFAQAATRIGLKNKIVKRKNLNNLSRPLLPVVLVLEDNQACVLLEPTKGMKEVYIYNPDTQQKEKIALKELKKRYTGYAILAHPENDFVNPAQPDEHSEAPTGPHWFWALVQQNSGIYGMALLGAVFINLFGLTSPLFIMNVYDRVIPNNAIETGWALGIGALTIFIFDLIMRSLRAYLVDLAGRRIDVVATQKIYDQVLNMKLSGRPRSSGAFANMLRDFDHVRDFFTSATITALVDLPFSLFFLFVIYQIGGPLVFILMLIFMIVLIAGLIIQIPLKNIVRKATKSAEAKHGLLVETINGLEAIKSINGDGRFRARYGHYVGENATLGQSSRFVSGLGVNVATFLQQIASILVVLAGMYLVRDGDLSVGGLIACVILSGRALAPVGQIANLMTRYHQSGGALKTLESIMSKPVERPADKQFLHRPDLKGEVKFENISFAYPGTGRKVLDGISFNISAGEKVGIIGRIGSGKSTAARLITGLYEPDEGTILIDGTDYRQIDPADLRRHTGYIAQDVVLFAGSVRDNITAGLPHASEDAILKAAKAAGVHDFIARHPMGYDAPVGERGEGLSGGQRQAIALARAMLLEPELLICDEPTNAMDMQAEAAFKRYIAEETKDKTLILITHKNTMLELVDRLILLDQGKLLMDGPRDKVVKRLQGGNAS